jgi:hypothetical protein
MQPTTPSDLERELERRRLRGHAPVTVRAMAARLAELGYRLDRSADCSSRARYVSGPNAGESYPATTTGVREIDSGLSFAHVDARRDENFHALQQLRFEGSLFAVVRGALFEI